MSTGLGLPTAPSCAAEGCARIVRSRNTAELPVTPVNGRTVTPVHGGNELFIVVNKHPNSRLFMEKKYALLTQFDQ